MKTPFNPASLIKKTVKSVSRTGVAPRPKAITDPPVSLGSPIQAQPDRTGAVTRPASDVGVTMPVVRPTTAPTVSYGTLLGYNKKKGK